MSGNNVYNSEKLLKGGCTNNHKMTLTIVGRLCVRRLGLEPLWSGRDYFFKIVCIYKIQEEIVGLRVGQKLECYCD